MSQKQFDDECAGCRPAILDIRTGKKLPDDSPVMVKANRIWQEATRGEREAFHRVCCLNSREPGDISQAQRLSRRMVAAEG